MKVTSDWIGMIGETGDFFIRLNSIRPTKKTVFAYNAETREGNYVVFFDSRSKEELKVAPGDCVLVRALVTGHKVSQYHGERETHFREVKILRNVGSKTNPKMNDPEEVPEAVEKSIDPFIIQTTIVPTTST